MRIRLLALVLLASGSAVASPSYPRAVRDALGLDEDPDCTLCHRDDNGGAKTAIKPFGRAAASHGALGASDIGSLKKALAAMEKVRVDSDGDGVSDTDELTERRDPNVYDPPPPEDSDGGTTEMPCPPLVREPLVLQTGCAVGGYPRMNGVLTGALGLVLALSARARRRSR